MDTNPKPDAMEQAKQTDIARSRWLDQEMHEIDIWCEHIGGRVREQIEFQRKHQSNFIDESEIVYGICVVINRLAQVEFLRHNVIYDRDFWPWLAEGTGWPDFVAQAFWFCIRHPTMHLGRPMMFADHHREYGDGYWLFADINGGWEYDEFTVRGPAIENKYLAGDIRKFNVWGPGWSSESGNLINFPNDVLNEKSVVVHFYMPGLLRALDGIRFRALEMLRAARYEDFMKLSELNKRTGILTQPGYIAPDHLLALDLDAQWPSSA